MPVYLTVCWMFLCPRECCNARVSWPSCELESTGVPQHVWVDREWHLGDLAEALDEAVEANS